MGLFTFNAIRFLVGGVAVLAFVSFVAPIRRKNGFSGAWRPSGQHPRLLWKGGIACGIILFAMITLQQAGICYTTVGKAGFITTLYILFVPLLSIFLGRKIPFTVFICMAIAMAGMYLLCINEEFTIDKGDIYVFLSAIVAAMHILLIGHFSPLVDSVKLSCLQFFVCGILSAICASLFEPLDFTAIISGWAPLLYAGLLSSGVAYTFQTVGQREINPVVASLIFSLEAVFSALSGWLILGERLSSKEMLGCVLIFVAIVMAQSPRLFTRFATRSYRR